MNWLKAFAGLCFLAAIGALIAQPSGEKCLGEFVTSMKGRTKNQAHNATLAMSKLAHVVVPPHGEFSFNKAVGTYTRDAGFRKAPVSYNGQLLEGWGGGVCQSSTTLYNAALLSGMQIVQRSRHRYAPLYAPPGRDAAVAYPNIDLVFRNPYDFPVTIRGRWVGERLIAGIYANGHTVESPRIVSRLLDKVDPATVALSPTTARGHVRNSGKAGFNVAVFREWNNRRELISRDEYPAMAKVVEYFGN